MIVQARFTNQFYLASILQQASHYSYYKIILIILGWSKIIYLFSFFFLFIYLYQLMIFANLCLLRIYVQYYKYSLDPNMLKIAYLLTLLIIIPSLRAIQLQLNDQQTCLDYIVKYENTKKSFHFHYNHNMDNVNMLLYHKNIKQIWYQSGVGIDYKTYFEVQYKQAGNYTLCFLKRSAGIADVSFDIVDEEDMSQYAGKQQLAKISRRISQFLVQIKKVGINFKQVLKQYNSRQQSIYVQQNSYGFLLFIKCIVMAFVIVVQVLIVKKLFK